MSNIAFFSVIFSFFGRNFFKIYFVLFLISLFLVFLLGLEKLNALISLNLLIIIFSPIVGLFFLITYLLPFELSTFLEYLLIIFIAFPIVFLDKFRAFLGRQFKKIWQKIKKS